jgi:hypothetical protein
LVDASFKGTDAPHPVLLTRKGTDALIQVEHMLDDANHARTARGSAGSFGALESTPDADKRTDTFATTADRSAASAPRGD